jgi:deazaflavin-dependent oxidoreductase (nitroreductase family)
MTDPDPAPAAVPGLDRESVANAIGRGGLVDITTRGRRSGRSRRIEIVAFAIDGRIWISGLPGRRDWLANLRADPHLIVHLKRHVRADFPATARLVSDPAERRDVLTQVTRAWRREHQLEAFLARSPLIEVVFDDPALRGPART